MILQGANCPGLGGFVLKWRTTLRRTMIPSITVMATLASLCPILAQPSGSGSISSGHQIAVTICGNCHEVPTSSRKTAIGPKLEDIANRPSTTALSLKEFLGSRHKNVCRIFFFLGPIQMT